jgi:hypothetical protein
MKPLIFQSWTEGGTGITNFSREQEPIYREAINEYGDLNLVISEQPIGNYHKKEISNCVFIRLSKRKT